MMQKSKRLNLIKEFLMKKKDVQISEFTSIIDASESTIRRDIKELAQTGFLKENYGSVILSESNIADVLLSDRLTKNIEVKNKIARKAAAKISDNDFVFIDAGSTTFQLIKYITANNITIITNGINIASESANMGYDVQLIGGTLKKVTMAVVGELAVQNIGNYYFDISFIGTNAISEIGYSTPDIREGVLKKQVAKNSRRSFILGDTSKVGKVTSFIFARVDECELISELEE